MLKLDGRAGVDAAAGGQDFADAELGMADHCPDGELRSGPGAGGGGTVVELGAAAGALGAAAGEEFFVEAAEGVGLVGDVQVDLAEFVEEAAGDGALGDAAEGAV